MANSLYLYMYICMYVCMYVYSDTSSTCSSRCTHARAMRKSLHQCLATLNNVHQRKQHATTACKEIHPQQQSRRDRDRQWKGIETPEREEGD